MPINYLSKIINPKHNINNISINNKIFVHSLNETYNK